MCVYVGLHNEYRVYIYICVYQGVSVGSSSELFLQSFCLIPHLQLIHSATTLQHSKQFDLRNSEVATLSFPERADNLFLLEVLVIGFIDKDSFFYTITISEFSGMAIIKLQGMWTKHIYLVLYTISAPVCWATQKNQVKRQSFNSFSHSTFKQNTCSQKRTDELWQNIFFLLSQ